ncbi:MAG TPA: LCP family protein, partial [Pseudonocardiaceae bacterium]
ALAFVRAAHVVEDPMAEDGRLRRQQRLLSALVRAAASGRTLTDPSRVNRIVAVMAANTFVDNVDGSQLATLAGALGGLNSEDVTFVTLPTTDAGDHRDLRREDATGLFRAIIDGSPLPGEAATGGAPTPGADTQPVAVPPEQIKLQVINGTGEGGLATNVAKRLRSVGFEVVKMDNATQNVDRTVIRYAAAREQQALSVAAAVPRAALQVDPAMGGAIEVILGSDFDGVIEAVRLGQPVPARPVVQAPPGSPVRLDTQNAADTSCA